MYETAQEQFWAGEFGDEYVDRNQGKLFVAGNVARLVNMTKVATKLDSVIEFGCNIGMNLQAFRTIFPEAKLHGVEINHKAAAAAAGVIGEDNVTIGSIFDVDLLDKFDLTFISGVLIHINPNYLNKVYEKLYSFSKKYICIAEYYNPVPDTVSYRGHDERLYKRDFAGEMLDKYSDLQLIDYGFTYHRDPKYRFDDINWFLLEKLR